MDRHEFDRLQNELKTTLGGVTCECAFPLNAAVEAMLAQHEKRSTAARACMDVQEQDLRLLGFFDITSVSATLAIRALSKKSDDTSGVSTALVDLWTQSEAARCLWFERFASRGEAEVDAKVEALKETARLLASEAIAVSIRMREPVTQYVEFVSKVVLS
jgi:hypothetical protein